MQKTPDFQRLDPLNKYEWSLEANMSHTLVTSKLPTELLWLVDAPMFIDTDLVERFYDAALRPSYRESVVTKTDSASDETMLSGKALSEAKVGVAGGFLATILGATADVKVGIEGGATDKHGKGASTATQWLRVDTPQRQLEQLVLAYYELAQDRLLICKSIDAKVLFDPETIEKLPRALVLLELPGQAEAEKLQLPYTTLIPTAAEFANGKVVTFYNQLQSEDKSLPPKVELGADANTLRRQRREYWNWYRAKIGSVQMMEVVERTASENGRLRWIDYRLPLTPECDTMHMHICPAGNYDTGVFAYNFIKRGYKHGLRIVGTLKSEPDLNVLVVYER
jgi:hypothetical protein